MQRLTITASVLLVCGTMVSVSAFGSNEEKFIKKYAMMKIYESCFGPEVVKQIRKEMKAACAKCAAYDQPPILQRPVPPSVHVYDNRDLQPPPHLPHQVADPENTLFANQQTFDADKLQQAILSYRPVQNPYASHLRPYQQQPYYNLQSSVPVPFLYPGYGQPQPYQQYAAFPLFGPQYYTTNRISRDMDIRNHIEALTTRSGKIRNVTCVMQELGYLDDNLEPNYEKMSDRINNLPVSEELRKDMLDGVAFCQQFSQCIPEVKKEQSPLSRELVRPMFFFKCYKHKKLEACVMKDVREKYAGIADDDFDGEVEFRRTGRAVFNANPPSDALATAMYDFLYGAESSIDTANVF